MPAVTVIPENLLVNWRAWWPGEADGVAADILARLADAVDAWALTDLALLPGGEAGLVLAATTPQGEAVLKLNPRLAGRTDELSGEAPALAIWAKVGAAPQAHGVRDENMTLLLERVRPGTSLRDMHTDPLTIVQTLGALCPLVHQEVDPGLFPHLGDGSEAAEWRRELVGTRELGELEQLLKPSSEDRLLHTDLHCLNALRAGERWVLIDPKPHVGDPHADVFAFMYGTPLSDIPPGRAAGRKHALRLTAAYAAAAGLDRDRVAAWLRVRALAVALWAQREEPLWASELFRLLDALS